MKRLLLWSFGGLLLVPLDALHVVSGTITHRAAGLEASIPLFVGAGILAGQAHRHIVARIASRLSAPASSPVEGLRALAVSLAFVIAYVSSSFVVDHNVAAAVAFTALFIAIVLLTRRDRKPSLLMMAAGLALVGPAFEGSFSSSGAFAYAQPDVFHVPVWLPPLYLLAGAAVSTVDHWLES